MTNIIGLTGTAHAGKDFAANIIDNHYALGTIGDNSVWKMAFADPIKEACKSLYNLDYDQLHDQDLKDKVDERWGISPRQMFQLIGDVMRSQDKDFFIKNMKQRIEEKLAYGNIKFIVVTDIRYDNEAEFIKGLSLNKQVSDSVAQEHLRCLNSKIIKIVRHDSKTTQFSDHSSEKGISKHLVSSIISNDCTPEFENKVVLIIDSLFDKVS